MNKADKQAKRQIYRRTIAGFLVFYLLAMVAVTAVAQAGVRRDNVNWLVQTVQKAAPLSEIDVKPWQRPNFSWDDRSYKPDIAFSEIAAISFYQTQWADFPVKLFVCDKHGAVLNETGTLLLVTPKELTEEQFEFMGRNDYALCLDDYMSEAELRQLWQLTNHGELGYQAEAEKALDLQLRAHWEGDQVIPSELNVLKTEWFPDGYGSKTRCVQETVASYRLGEAQADDVDHAVTIMFEGHFRSGSDKPIYDSRTQRGFRESAQVLDTVKAFLQEDSDLVSANHGQGLWQYDIYALKSIEADIDGLPASYVIATARTYPFLQAMANLWPLYLAGLGVALALAMLMGRALLRVNRRERQLDESRQALLAAVAHELKNPLSIIRGYSEGLKEDIAAEKRADYLDTIIDETERMDDMVVEMLRLTQLTSAGYTLKRQPIALAELVDAVCARWQRQLAAGGITLSREISPDAAVTADQRLLEQAVANLLSNAIRHTPPGGCITITADGDRLTIDNDGPTLTDEQWAHLFEPFYKAEDHRQTVSGTGLGLSIVRAIADLHSMRVYGANRDGGVRFTIEFQPHEKD